MENLAKISTFKKTKIMASGPITSWQIDGKTMETVFLGGFKITADGDCRHEIKRRLLLGTKVMTKKIGKTTRSFRYDVNQIP